MSYFSKKVKHAYKCFKKGQPRKKVYGVVEKGDKFVVIKNKEGDKYKYAISGGGIEKKEDAKTAIIREILEELNIKAEYIRTLGHFQTKSKWNYKGKEFWVNDDIEVVYTKFIEYGKNKSYGIKGEFKNQDVVAEITRQEMEDTVAEFVEYGIEL